MAQNELDPSTAHPDFCEITKKYDVTEDAFEGDVCEYVEVLDGQTVDERKSYINRAAYFGVVQPTVSALLGTLYRKPYSMQGTFPQTDFKSVDAFLQTCSKNILLGSRNVLFVTVENGASKIVVYDADDIINWSDDFVVIKEEMLVRDAKNPFKLVEQCSYRELYIGDDGMYHSRRWMKTGKQGKWVFEDLEDLVTATGQLIDYLPVFPMNQYDTTWDVYTPPLFTQAGQNIQHFKMMCDLSHYAHFMALPTPYIAGDLARYTDTETGESVTAKVHLGSTKEVLHLEKDAQCGYMEVSGASFSMLQNELKNIEERMFMAGSRLLTNKAGVESASALQLRASNETAVLETMTNALEGALNQALALCSELDREPKSIVLNKDFNSAVVDPATIKSLLELFTAGVISLDQFQSRLYSGEIVVKSGTEPVDVA